RPGPLPLSGGRGPGGRHHRRGRCLQRCAGGLPGTVAGTAVRHARAVRDALCRDVDRAPGRGGFDAGRGGIRRALSAGLSAAGLPGRGIGDNAAMRIGPHAIAPNVVLAPMAGVTDKPFRLLCKRLGAGLAMSEMTISDRRFWGTEKSLRRMDHAGEPDPVGVQIAGTEPAQLADAARYNVDHGARIIDINMGCPAKKVCNAWAGSALMRDEALVARIL